MLDLVAHVVANNGTLPEFDQLNARKTWLTRTFGLKISAVWFILVVLLLLPLAGATGAPDEVAGGLAILGFFGTFLLIALSWMFLPKSHRASSPIGAYGAEASAAAQYVPAARQNQALPPSQSIPVNAYAGPGNWRDTNDLQPTSVTEGTTRILNDNERI